MRLFNIAALVFVLAGCSEFDLADRTEPPEPGFTPEELVSVTPEEPREPPPPVDVFMVLDNSCSMSEDWGMLTYGLVRVIEDLDSESVDWKLIVTSMTAADSIMYTLEPNPAEDTGWRMVETLEEFRSRSGADEQGLESAVTKREEFNNEFRNVDEILVFVTDEPDQSAITVDDFRDNYPSYPYIIGVIGSYANRNDSPCLAEYGEGYDEVSNRIIDVCVTEPWSIFD